MDNIEVEENLYATGDANLHGEMCRKLSTIVGKVLEIFPILEATRPRSKSGIQSLCSLHVALDKAKNLLQHCSNCSKLYLAVTIDSTLLKFEKIKYSLQESLRSVIDIVSQATGFQIMAIVAELEDTIFELDRFEKLAGDELVQLLSNDKKNNGDSSVIEELESFRQVVMWLGITTARTALTERRALKQLIQRAHVDEDKRKETIILCLLHLMRKYSKLFKTSSQDIDSQGSTPCTPTMMGDSKIFCNIGKENTFEKQVSKMNPFYNSSQRMNPRGIPTPPEELRCPISLQLMYDPVIISSGQTYERVFIEKWLNDGHHTCPKSQQSLSHLFLTPNYGVKGLVSNWCEQNGVPIPQGPPHSLNLYCDILPETEVTKTKKKIGLDSDNENDSIMDSLEIQHVKEEVQENTTNTLSDISNEYCEADKLEKYKNLLLVLYENNNIGEQVKAIEQIRFSLKNDDKARVYMGEIGFSEALIKFLELAIQEGDEKAQEVGAMALFNFGVNNYKNKEMLLSGGVIPLLEEMINYNSYEAAIALYLNLSFLDDAKLIIGSSKVVSQLVQILNEGNSTLQCQNDALDTLYNLSSISSNVTSLLSIGIVNNLHSIIINLMEYMKDKRLEKSIAILTNLLSNKQGKEYITSMDGLVTTIATFLDTGQSTLKEKALSFFLVLCEGDKRCIRVVLQEGVIPALVSATINGTPKGKDKAQKLLTLFREHRKREPSPSRAPTPPPPPPPQLKVNKIDSPRSIEPKHLPKLSSRKFGRTITAIWKSRPLYVQRQ